MIGAFFGSIVPSGNSEAFMRLGVIQYLAGPRILWRIDRALAVRIRRAADVQPDTPVSFGPDAHKRTKLPGRRTQQPHQTRNRQEALRAEKTSYAFVLFVIKAFAESKDSI
jgi:hypothetical protein